MVSLSTDVLQTIDLEKTSVPNLNSQGTFDWFGTLPKRCQELFEDAVLISDRRKSVYGKWDDILSSIHISPTCVVTKRALAQFFTKSQLDSCSFSESTRAVAISRLPYPTQGSNITSI